MRRAFIAIGILIFLAYCWASVVYQNQVDVPRYRDVEIDVLGGMSREAWEGDQQAQFQRLMDLENKSYQPPEGAAGDAARPVSADGFAAYVAAHPGAPVMMKLRDTGEFQDLLARKFVLRDSIYNPDDPMGEPVYFGGRPLDKPMLDDLLKRGMRVITVTGHAAPVNFQLGTALMIAVIFFTLVAALKPVVWDPFLVMLEKRKKELDKGQEAERANQVEADRFAREKDRRNGELGREIQALRMNGQRETAQAAGEIVKAAREREKEVKLAGLKEIADASDKVRGDLEKRIPELAKAVAEAVTPGNGGPRWDRMDEEHL